VITGRVLRGVTLITFYNSAYCGFDHELSFEEWMGAVYGNPRFYFDRMLDGVVEAGVEGIELAPGPGGWEGVLRAYGSVEGAGRELSKRGLRLGSSYQDGGALIGDALADRGTERKADDYTRRHAELVAALGGEIIVMGTVGRTQFTGGDFEADVPGEVFDRVAEQINRMAAMSAQCGVRIALHTDAYSVCSRNRDIACMLARTDPGSVALCLDAGHTTLDGGDAVEALRQHVARTPVMHWKDCVCPVDASTLPGPQMERHAVMLKYFRTLGEGMIDWQAWQHVLADAAWSGWAMVENDMAEDPVMEIKRALAFFERELAPIYR
jgi:inosose dehydratase